MSLLEEFQNRRTKKPLVQAKKIMFNLVGTLLDSGQFGDQWDMIPTEHQEKILTILLQGVENDLRFNAR